MAVNKTKALAAADKHIAKGNFQKALNELLKVEKVSANDVNLINKIGDLYSKLDKKSEATKYLTRVADHYQKGGFNLKAIAVYKKIIRIDERFMDARDRLVGLYMQQGHHSEARGELRRMAEHYHSENLFSRALNCYEKIVQIDPSNLDARIKITELLLREGKRADAARHFVAMARELLEKSMVNEAQKIISRGIKVDPQNVDLKVLHAQVYIAEGKTDEALALLTEICRSNESDLNALRILGQTYFNRGQLRDANACFIRALHISTEEIAPLEEVAREFIKAGQLDDAYNSLTHVSEVFVAEEDYEEAIRLFRSILYVDANHIPSLEMLVSIYERSGQISTAILNQEKIIQHYKASGETARVVRQIQRLLELDPDNAEWKSRLEAMAGRLEAEKEGPPPPPPPSMAQKQPPPEPEIIEESDAGPQDASELVFDDDDMSFEEEADATVLKAPPEGEGATEDTQTRIANFITDAEMSLKYDLIDQALEYLKSVKELDHLNLKANILLKKIYIDRGEHDNAVGCLVCLLNAYLESERAEEAQTVLGEINQMRPDIAQIHKARLDALLPQQTHMINDDFSAGDIVGIEEPGIAQTGDGIVFDDAPPQEQEVVDFSKIEPTEPDIRGPEGDSWSLDIPEAASDVATEGGFDLDFAVDEDEPSEPVMDVAEIPEDSGSGFFAGDEDDSQDELTEVVDEIDDSINIDMIGDLDDEEVEASVTEEAPDPEAAEELKPEMVEDAPEPVAEKAPEPAVSNPPQPALEDHVSLDEGTLDDSDVDLSFLDDEDEGGAAEQTEDAPVQEPEPQTASAAQSPDLDSLAGELEEIDFFISVEAFDDARNLINDALERFGEHPLIMERQHEVIDKTQAVDRRRMTFQADPSPEDDDDEDDSLLDDGTGFFDLAAELNEELFEEESEIDVNDNTSQEEIRTVDELFEEFKKGVDQQIDEEDHQTHYDLGIAYKEMGLLDEAINEFRRAQVGPGRFLECITMIGGCLLELGRNDEMAALFERAVDKDGLNPEESVILYYELGRAYENLGETEKALGAFYRVRETDPSYRDLEERIESLV